MILDTLLTVGLGLAAIILLYIGLYIAVRLPPHIRKWKDTKIIWNLSIFDFMILTIACLIFGSMTRACLGL